MNNEEKKFLEEIKSTLEEMKKDGIIEEVEKEKYRLTPKGVTHAEKLINKILDELYKERKKLDS